MSAIAGWGALAGGLSRGALNTAEAGTRYQAGQREQTAFDAERKGWMDAADAMEKQGYGQFAAQLRAYHGLSVPKVGPQGAEGDLKANPVDKSSYPLPLNPALAAAPAGPSATPPGAMNP